MTNKRAAYKFFIGLVLMAAGVATLLGLGFWQLERLAWKEGLIAQIAAHQTETVPLEAYIADPSAEFRHGTLEGRWLADQTFKTAPRLMDGNFGYWFVTPLTFGDGAKIMVLRGWVQDGQQDRVMAVPLPDGAVTVQGTLRRPGVLADKVPASGYSPWVLFMEKSIPADHPEMVAAPVVVELRNDHKQYAIFWFTMAGILLSFMAFSLLRRRSAS